jgi:ankyrin repeat protein
MAEILVRHGADIHQRRKDGRTAHTLAEMHGNPDVAAWLLAQGAKDELSPLEQFISACTRADRAHADTILQARPGLRGGLRPEHHLMLHVLAERGAASALDTMLACGFDANATSSDGATALHQAAMKGRADAVRVLLAHGAAANALDGMFSATPLMWAAEGWTHNCDPGADYLAAARLLINAGSSLEWRPPRNAPDPEGGQERLIELCRAAGAA